MGEAQDVAVKDLIVNPVVFVKNELTITGQVRVDGYVNVPIPVRVLFETASGKMEAVAQQTVKATADGQLLPVKLSYVPQAPGEYRLTLEAVAQPGELVTTNNRLSTFVQVLKGGLNVLYLTGALGGGESPFSAARWLLARHQTRLRADRSPRSEGPAGRLARSLQAGQVRRVHLGRHRLPRPSKATSWPIWRSASTAGRA